MIEHQTFNHRKLNIHFLKKVGVLVESFGMQELQKQMSWHDRPLKLLYYRTAGGREVDFVLETMDGRIVGLEVKSAASVQPRDFKGLTDLAETVGERFMRGIVLYLGQNTVPFGDTITAMRSGVKVTP